MCRDVETSETSMGSYKLNYYYYSGISVLSERTFSEHVSVAPSKKSYKMNKYEGQYLVNICMKKCVFSFILKVGRLSLLAGSESSIGRLFQAVGQATAKALGPIVFVLQEGTKSLPDVAERKWERPGNSDTGMHSLERYDGARPWRHRYAVTHSLNSIRACISSQWSRSCIAFVTWPDRGSWRISRAAARMTPSSCFIRRTGIPLSRPLQ